MAVAILRKTFNHDDNNLIIDSFNYISILNKYVLKVSNQLFHNQKINRLLVTSYLLNLLDYYFLKTIIKITNIALL